MAQMFTFEFREIFKMVRIFQRMPKLFAVGSGMLINNFAFKTKDEIIEYMPQKMMVRSPGFMKSSLRIRKSHFRMPMSSQSSEVGSIRRDRFTGWVEQELGGIADRERAATLEGRMGSKRKKIRPGARFKPGVDFPDPFDYPGEPIGGFAGTVNEHQRAHVMVRTLARRRYRKPFLIRRYRYATPGLYKFDGQDLIKLQSTKPRTKSVKKVKWLRQSRRRMFAKINLDREWIKIMKRILVRRKLV
jgi:hypothetical protein